MPEATGIEVVLPGSLQAEVERLAREAGIGVEPFIALAVAEKVGALRTAAFFAERRTRADLPAFDRLLARTGGEPPRDGDEAG